VQTYTVYGCGEHVEQTKGKEGLGKGEGKGNGRETVMSVNLFPTSSCDIV